VAGGDEVTVMVLLAVVAAFMVVARHLMRSDRWEDR
jgi:hypothetical protein